MPSTQDGATPLRKAREASGLTQYEVAERAEMNQGHLSRLEADIEGCSPAMAERLAKIFKRYGLNELHILYPKRFKAFRPAGTAGSR